MPSFSIINRIVHESTHTHTHTQLPRAPDHHHHCSIAISSHCVLIIENLLHWDVADYYCYYVAIGEAKEILWCVV